MKINIANAIAIDSNGVGKRCTLLSSIWTSQLRLYLPTFMWTMDMSLWLTESPPSPITVVMTIGSVCKSQSMHNDFFIGWPIHSCIEDGLLLKSCSPSAVFGENPWEICLGCCSNGGWGSHPCSKALLFFFFCFSQEPHFTIVCVHHHHHRDNCFDLSQALFDISISNIDCRYINTFEKYRYWHGHFWKYRYR